MKRLRQQAKRYRTAQDRLALERTVLYAYIITAHAEGMTVRAIAAETGLTFGRVGQIVRVPSG